MPNGYNERLERLWIERGQFSGLSKAAFMAGYSEFLKKPWREQTPTMQYMYGWDDTPSAGYGQRAQVFPGTDRLMPTTYGAGVGPGQDVEFLKQFWGSAAGASPAGVKQAIENAPLNDYQKNVLWSQWQMKYGGAVETLGKYFQAQYPLAFKALAPEIEQLYGTRGGYTNEELQRFRELFAKREEYEKAQPATAGYGATGLGASYQAAYLASLPEGLSPAQREYYQTQATPMYQSFLAKQYPAGTQVPPTEQLMPGFKTYLGEYPWLEKWTEMPQRARGEYPSRYRPPTRWLNYQVNYAEW